MRTFTTKMISPWHKDFGKEVEVFSETQEQAAQERFADMWVTTSMSPEQFEGLSIEVEGRIFSPTIHVAGVTEIGP